MQCQERCLNCLMASCKKERPTIQQKEKLKNKHQNPLLGGVSNGKYWFSTTTHPATTNQIPQSTKEPIRHSRRIQQQNEQREN